MLNDYILRLDIPVYHPIAMNVGDRLIDVAEDVQNFIFGEFLPLFDEFVEVVA